MLSPVVSLVETEHTGNLMFDPKVGCSIVYFKAASNYGEPTEDK